MYTIDSESRKRLEQISEWSSLIAAVIGGGTEGLQKRDSRSRKRSLQKSLSVMN